jgi:hypothetical protein
MMCDSLIGTSVLIRDSSAGVMFGTLESVDGKSWRLAAGARKIHFWRRAGAVEGVAVRGIDPQASRVTAASSRPVVGFDAVQVIGLTEAEFATLNSVPEWRP